MQVTRQLIVCVVGSVRPVRPIAALGSSWGLPNSSRYLLDLRSRCGIRRYASVFGLGTCGCNPRTASSATRRYVCRLSCPGSRGVRPALGGRGWPSAVAELGFRPGMSIAGPRPRRNSAPSTRCLGPHCWSMTVTPKSRDAGNRKAPATYLTCPMKTDIGKAVYQ